MIKDKLSGGNIILRRKRPEDVSNDYIWRSGPELSRMDAAPRLNISIDEFKKIFEEQLRYPSPDTYRFAIDTAIGKHIGNCMYYDIDFGKGQAELGIMIGNRDYWSRGYGTDVVNTLHSVIWHYFQTFSSTATEHGQSSALLEPPFRALASRTLA